MTNLTTRYAGILCLFCLILFSPAEAAEARVNQLYTTTCTACGLQQQSITLGNTVPSISNFRFVSQNPNDPSFTGNDLKGTLIYTSHSNTQVVIFGIISRTIKNGNQQLGVYLAETDNGWQTLTGKAYVLVIPGQEANLTPGQTYGSASDPMDNVLNSPVLPVTGLSLKAQRQGSAALLQWSVLSEKSGDRYLLERSADGRQYATIASIGARGWNGLANSYQHSDQPNSSRAVFYRIRATDASGKQTFSNTASVNFSQVRGGHQLYPNPAKGEAFLSFDKAGSFEITLLSSSGQVIASRKVASASAGSTTAIGSLSLAPGLYTVRIIDSETGNTSSKRLIIH